ncbi:MAG: hypothetical protein J6I96_03730 [Oscillospiraceae bacterium]|nr:hypothetical protein [Oscillospiraceae bacterium]
MKVLTKSMSLIFALIMSVNLSGCGNKAGAEISQPAETTAETTVVQSVDEEKPFELTNSIVIDGHEYSLPTDLESLSESVIVNKDAKSGSNIWYEDKENKIGAVFLDNGKVYSIDIDPAVKLPNIQISGVAISNGLTYDDFYDIVRNSSPDLSTMDYKIVRIKNDNLVCVTLFDNEGKFQGIRFQKLKEE